MNWNLSLLYPSFDSREFLDDCVACDKAFGTVEEKLASLGTAGDATRELHEFVEALSDAVSREMKLDLFIFLTLATDSSNEAALSHHNETLLRSVRMRKIESAFNKYLAGRDLEALIGSDEYLSLHSYWLATCRDNASHALDSEIEDAVLSMQMTGGSAFEQLVDQVTSAHTVPFEVDGKTERLPLAKIRGLAYSADSDVRRRAYEAELASYPDIEIPVAACLNALKGEALTMIRYRRFDSVLDWALDSSHMDRKTLDALIGSLYDALPAFRRYFRAKAHALGYEGGLKFEDLFAPLGSSTRTYTIQEARELLVKILGTFSDKMARHIDDAFERELIDVYPKAGKQGGAFCAPAHPVGLSFVMTNFDGSLSSVSTIAHELGHAYHNRCLFDSPVLISDYPMPLAETASIFNETLFAEKLLADCDEGSRLMLLDQQLTDAAQVIVDILSRYIFETEVIERRKERTLSPRELCAIMLDAQDRTYGDGLDKDHRHPYMWACKGHYYSTDTHFYNFPYAFGLLFGTGVYARYIEKGDAFLPEYDALLASSGSGSVRDVALSAGIDVTSPDFWHSSITVFEKKIAEFESLVYKA